MPQGRAQSKNKRGAFVSTQRKAATLPFATANFHVEADDAVLVADRNHRDVTGNVVFGPDDLLRSLRNVSCVSDGEIVFDLLLDSNGWAGLGRGSFGHKTLRINFDTAVSKQALRAIVERRVEGRGQHRAGS